MFMPPVFVPTQPRCVLWLLQLGRAVPESAGAAAEEDGEGQGKCGHVMLSYNQASTQPYVRRLKERLQARPSPTPPQQARPNADAMAPT